MFIGRNMMLIDSIDVYSFYVYRCCLQPGGSLTTYLLWGANLRASLYNILNWILTSTYLHKGSNPPPLLKSEEYIERDLHYTHTYMFTYIDIWKYETLPQH